MYQILIIVAYTQIQNVLVSARRMNPLILVKFYTLQIMDENILAVSTCH